VFVPDFVMAFTWMPAERPCAASKRLVITWNSAIDSRLKFGLVNVPATVCVTCCPSIVRL
jgi:hypothetical protein